MNEDNNNNDGKMAHGEEEEEEEEAAAAPETSQRGRKFVPYWCPMCTDMCVDKRSFDHHLGRAHPKCSKCLRRFATVVDFNEHVRAGHVVNSEANPSAIPSMQQHQQQQIGQVVAASTSAISSSTSPSSASATVTRSSASASSSSTSSSSTSTSSTLASSQPPRAPLIPMTLFTIDEQGNEDIYDCFVDPTPVDPSQSEEIRQAMLECMQSPLWNVNATLNLRL